MGFQLSQLIVEGQQLRLSGTVGEEPVRVPRDAGGGPLPLAQIFTAPERGQLIARQDRLLQLARRGLPAGVSFELVRFVWGRDGRVTVEGEYRDSTGRPVKSEAKTMSYRPITSGEIRAALQLPYPLSAAAAQALIADISPFNDLEYGQINTLIDAAEVRGQALEA